MNQKLESKFFLPVTKPLYFETELETISSSSSGQYGNIKDTKKYKAVKN